MSGRRAADEIDRIIRGELDDCERAIKRDDKRVALREIDDAMTKLKRLAETVRRLDGA